jgi:hypothetical protein
LAWLGVGFFSHGEHGEQREAFLKRNGVYGEKRRSAKYFWDIKTYGGIM